MQQALSTINNLHRRSGRRGGLTMPVYKFIDDILEPWLREDREGKKIGTLRTEAYGTKPLFEFFEGWSVSGSSSKRFKIIDGTQVKAYREWRKSNGVGAVTISNELRFAVTACNYAIAEKNYSMPNPFSMRTISKKDRKAKHASMAEISGREYWSDAEEKRFTLAARPIAADMLVFALNTGLRINEICELVYEDVIDGRPYTRIDGRKLTFAPKDQKNGTWGASFMNDEAYRVLQRQKPVICDETKLLYAFSWNGNKVNKYTASRLYREARRNAGLPEYLHFKHARKAAGQRMLDAGAKMEGVQAQLRHLSIRTTESWYVKPSLSQAELAIRTLNK
jgi:integrase